MSKCKNEVGGELPHQLGKWHGRADIEGYVRKGKVLAKEAQMLTKNHSSLQMSPLREQQANK